MIERELYKSFRIKYLEIVGKSSRDVKLLKTRELGRPRPPSSGEHVHEGRFSHVVSNVLILKHLTSTQV